MKSSLKQLKILWIAAALAGGILQCVVASRGLHLEINYEHEFRQTQTALSARTILEGGPWIAYETPVMGAPWSIPFEAPVYQWIIAGTCYALGTPLHETARVWNLIFFFLSWIPIFRIVRRLKFPAWAGWTAIAFYSVSPFYAHWNHMFLIEPLALAATLAYVDFAFAALEHEPKKAGKKKREAPAPAYGRPLAAAAAWGAFAALVKLTTLWPGLLAVAIYAFHSGWLSRGRLLEARRRAIFLVGGLWGIPGLAGVLWTSYADAMKRANPLAADFITSKMLNDWNFGNLETRLSAKFWDMLVDYVSYMALGGWTPLLLGLLALVAMRTRRVGVIAAIVVFLSAPAVFANLYSVHTYYAYANCVYLVLAVALAFAGWMDGAGRLSRIGTVFALGVWMNAAWVSYGQEFVQVNWDAEIISEVRRLVPEDRTLVVYGRDWSPVLPYYTHRRALMDRWELPLTDPKMKAELAQLEQARSPIGGVLFCGASRQSLALVQSRIEGFGLAPAPATFRNDCDLYLPRTNRSSSGA